MCFFFVRFGNHGVFWKLGDGASVKHPRDTTVVILVFVSLRKEVDVQPFDVGLYVKLLRRCGRLGLKTYLERAEAVYLHTLGVLHGACHRGHKFAKNGFYVRTLYGAVLLHYLRQLACCHRFGYYGTGVPLLVSTALLVVVLIQSVKY